MPNAGIKWAFFSCWCTRCSITLGTTTRAHVHTPSMSFKNFRVYNSVTAGRTGLKFGMWVESHWLSDLQVS